MVSGVILSGGTSRRMGSPKALLRIGGTTFLGHLIDVLRSSRVLDIVVVLGADAETISPALSSLEGKIVVNERWQEGQLTSVNAGIDALEKKDLDGAIVCPVDHPAITQRLVVGLLQEFWKTRKSVVIPTFQGRRGHPVIFRSSLFDALKNGSPEKGARAVVHEHAGDVAEVATEVEGVIMNIDTPADYDALRARWKS